MSDISDYYSGSSDSETETYVSKNPIKNAKPSSLTLNKSKNNFQSYINDSDEEESDNEQTGGELEEGELEEGELELDVDVDEEGQEDELEDGEVDEDEDDDDSVNPEENALKSSKNKTTKSKSPHISIHNDDENMDEEYDDNDDEEDEDDKYLQKFDSELTKNYITSFHPECMQHNFDEISKMTKIVKDSDGIIIDPLHRTIPYLTKYEKARILGQRAKQIENGSKPFVKVPESVIDGYVIAEFELQQKKIPFIIRRPIPGGGSEYWDLNDLENIGF
jgi:DNA-directed RNA polymerase I, II, and III subunit RPABC2